MIQDNAQYKEIGDEPDSEPGSTTKYKKMTSATSIEQAIEMKGTFLAGGTDYMDRYRHHLIAEQPVDLTGIKGLDQIETDATGQTTIGSLTTIFNVSQNALLREKYAGLAIAAGALATPQIRQVATIAGNLTQATRCPYYRHSHLTCTKKGDKVCGGREGYHAYGVIFDNGGCTHPHPSTLGMALMAYDAEIVINGLVSRSIFDLYGDGSDHTKDHLLREDELITSIRLPKAATNEKAAYFRVSSRARAEWALVECVARLVMEDDLITSAYIAVGAVGPVPLRLPKVEAALIGKSSTGEVFAEAAVNAAEGSNPLPQTEYKVPLLINTTEETLLLAAGIE